MKCSQHRISGQRICDNCMAQIEHKIKQEKADSRKLPKIPGHIAKNMTKAAYAKLQSEYTKAEIIRQARILNKPSSTKPSSRLKFPIDNVVSSPDDDSLAESYADDVFKPGRYVTSKNIKYKTMGMAVNVLREQHGNIRVTQSAPDANIDYDPESLMRRRSDGGKLIYLMTGQKDARAVQVKDFVEFMQIIDQRCLESQLKTLYGLLEDKRKRAVTRDGIHKLLRGKWGNWIGELQKRLNQVLVSMVSELQLPESKKYGRGVSFKPPQKKAIAMSPFVIDALEIIEVNKSDRERIALLEKLLAQDELTSDMAILFVRHGYSQETKQFTKIPSWELLEEDLKSPQAVKRIRPNRYEIDSPKAIVHYGMMDLARRESKVMVNGILWKKGGTVGNWKRRFCELLPDFSFIYRETENTDATRGSTTFQRASMFRRREAKDFNAPDEAKFIFEVHTPRRTWIFGAEHVKDVIMWQKGLENIPGCKIIDK